MIKKYLKLFLSETSEPFDNKYGWNGAQMILGQKYSECRSKIQVECHCIAKFKHNTLGKRKYIFSKTES